MNALTSSSFDSDILEYQLHLRDVRNVSFAFFTQVMCALRFFYAEVLGREEMLARIPFMRRERHLPFVLSTDEVLRLLGAPVSLRDRVLITLTYSAGLRLGEACRLEVGDIDSDRMLIRVRQGEGPQGSLRTSVACHARVAAGLVSRHAPEGSAVPDEEGSVQAYPSLHVPARPAPCGDDAGGA